MLTSGPPPSCRYCGKVKIPHQVVALNTTAAPPAATGVLMRENSLNANARSALHERDASVSAAHQTGGFSGRRGTQTHWLSWGDGILSKVCVCVLATYISFMLFPAGS